MVVIKDDVEYKVKLDHILYSRRKTAEDRVYETHMLIKEQDARNKSTKKEN